MTFKGQMNVITFKMFTSQMMIILIKVCINVAHNFIYYRVTGKCIGLLVHFMTCDLG